MSVRTTIMMILPVVFAGDPNPPASGVSAATGGFSCKDAKDAYMSSSCCGATDPDALDFVPPLSTNCGAVYGKMTMAMPFSITSTALTNLADLGITPDFCNCELNEDTTDTFFDFSAEFCASPLPYVTGKFASAALPGETCSTCKVGDQPPEPLLKALMMGPMMAQMCPAPGRQLREVPKVSQMKSHPLVQSLRAHRKLGAGEEEEDGPPWYQGAAGILFYSESMDMTTYTQMADMVFHTYATFLESINGFSMMASLLKTMDGAMSVAVSAPDQVKNIYHTWTDPFLAMMGLPASSNASLTSMVNTFTANSKDSSPSQFIARHKPAICAASTLPN